jgi:MFS family permease
MSAGPVASAATTPTAPARPGRAEWLIVPGNFITCLGNGIQLDATGVLLVRADKTALAVGWLFIVVAVPQVLLSWWFGRVADRYDRRMLCTLSDLTSAAAALALPVWLILGGAASTSSYVSNFALAAVAGLFMPASNALIKERIPQARLGRFNSHFEISTQAGTLLSAAVGGFMIQLYGVKPLLFFNAATFLASAMFWIALGRRPATPLSTAQSAVGVNDSGPAGSAAGARPARQSPLAWLGLLYGSGQLVITASNTLLVVLILESFRRGPGYLGLVDTFAGVGVMFAAAWFPRVSNRIRGPRLAFLGMLGSAVCMAIEPFNVYATMVIIFFSGLLFGMARIAARTMLMSAVEESRAGRVFGATNAFGLGLGAVVTIGLALVSDHATIKIGFFCLAGVTALIVSGASYAIHRTRSHTSRASAG